MLKLKLMNIGIISLAKVLAVLYALLGLVMGVFVAVSKLMGMELTGDAAQLQNMGFAAILILPIMYALIGVVSGLVSGFFFNTAIKWIGPLELNVSEKQ